MTDRGGSCCPYHHVCPVHGLVGGGYDGTGVYCRRCEPNRDPDPIPDTDPGSPNVGAVTDRDRLEAAQRWIQHALNGDCTALEAANSAIAILHRIW